MLAQLGTDSCGHYQAKLAHTRKRLAVRVFQSLPMLVGHAPLGFI